MSRVEEKTEAAGPPQAVPGDPWLGHVVPPVDVAFGGLSHRGNVRERNEDHFVVLRRTRRCETLLTNAPLDGLTAPDEHAFVFIVADGMGGAACGDLASQLALQAGFEWGARSAQWLMKMNDTQAETLPDRAKSWANFIQAALREKVKDNPSLAGMGTTLTAACAIGASLVVSHIGDSRAYLLREGVLHRLTRDHTVAQELIDAGYPAENLGAFRHLLTNCLGAADRPVKIELVKIELAPGDGLLLCTDGLVDALTEEQLAAILNSHDAPQDACSAAVAAALETPARDNITAVFARFRF